LQAALSVTARLPSTRNAGAGLNRTAGAPN
jgi:hypothetical protein